MRLIGNARGHRQEVVTPKWAQAGEHLVQHDADRKQVRAAVEFFAARLLGGHVLRCPDHVAHTRAHLGRPSATVFNVGNTKVGDFDCARGRVTHDVAGLDVAVYHPAFVRVVERTRQLQGDGDGLPNGQLPRAFKLFGQGLASEHFHGHVRPTLDFADVVYDHDIGVRQAPCGPRFTQKAAAAFGVLTQCCMQELERHVASNGRVMRLENRGHATPSKALFHLIAPNVMGHAVIARGGAGQSVGRGGTGCEGVADGQQGAVAHQDGGRKVCLTGGAREGLRALCGIVRVHGA